MSLIGRMGPWLAGGDPNWSLRSLGLHMNGPPGSTSFIDNSPSPKTVTADGGAQISTTGSLYNGSSGLFDGSGDLLTIPHSSTFSVTNGKLTIETAFNTNSVTGNHALVGKRGNTTPTIEYQLVLVGNKLYVDFGFSGGLVSIMGTTVVATSAWHHASLDIDGTSVKLFLNGNLEGSGTGSGTAHTGTDALRVGASPVSTQEWYWNGKLAETLIYPGVSLRSGNFTPPNAPFLDY